jgi:hypothetical protein
MPNEFYEQVIANTDLKTEHIKVIADLIVKVKFFPQIPILFEALQYAFKPIRFIHELGATKVYFSLLIYEYRCCSASSLRTRGKGMASPL